MRRPLPAGTHAGILSPRPVRYESPANRGFTVNNAIVWAFLTLFTLLSPTSRAAADPLDVADRRQLFVDRRLIESLDGGAALKLHTPRPAGTALTFDRPWEGRFCAYATVFKDGDVFRMYYRGTSESGKDGNKGEFTCYAESPDGVTWTKPDLGLFDVHGTRQNNVILDTPPYCHNFSPFIDGRPGVASAERYKAAAGIAPGGLAFFASPD